ncbi:MAG: hydrolase [Streptosporangiales bacterium]|nr:hydrolase [Streptosporangiales bacterium]
MSTSQTKVAVMQFAAGSDKDENLATVQRLFDQLRTTLGSDSAPAMVVLPEAAMREFGPAGDQLAPHAEPLDGPFVQELAKLAKDHATTVVAGVFESGDGDRVYNTLVALDPAGDLVGAYRKVHLYDAFAFRESDRLIAGTEEPPVLTGVLPGLTVGLQTCYDLRFPETSRSLIDRGTDVIVLPAAWVRGPLKEDHWATLVKARAIENTSYVVASGQCGQVCAGNSMVVDPHGVTVGSLGEQEGVFTALLDPARIAEVRKVNPSLTNRRYPVTTLGG